MAFSNIAALSSPRPRPPVSALGKQAADLELAGDMTSYRKVNQKQRREEQNLKDKISAIASDKKHFQLYMEAEKRKLESKMSAFRSARRKHTDVTPAGARPDTVAANNKDNNSHLPRIWLTRAGTPEIVEDEKGHILQGFITIASSNEPENGTFLTSMNDECDGGGDEDGDVKINLTGYRPLMSGRDANGSPIRQQVEQRGRNKERASRLALSQAIDATVVRSMTGLQPGLRLSSPNRSPASPSSKRRSVSPASGALCLERQAEAQRLRRESPEASSRPGARQRPSSSPSVPNRTPQDVEDNTSGSRRGDSWYGLPCFAVSSPSSPRRQAKPTTPSSKCQSAAVPVQTAAPQNDGGSPDQTGSRHIPDLSGSNTVSTHSPKQAALCSSPSAPDYGNWNTKAGNVYFLTYKEYDCRRTKGSPARRAVVSRTDQQPGSRERLVDKDGDIKMRTPSTEELNFLRRALSDSREVIVPASLRANPGLLSASWSSSLPQIDPHSARRHGSTPRLLDRQTITNSATNLPALANNEQSETVEIFEFDDDFDLPPVPRERSATFSGRINTGDD